MNLLEVFRRKKRLFLVFEFVDRTVLDDLEKYPEGLQDENVKSISFQVLRGLEFCHSHNVRTFVCLFVCFMCILPTCIVFMAKQLLLNVEWLSLVAHLSKILSSRKIGRVT